MLKRQISLNDGYVISEASEVISDFVHISMNHFERYSQEVSEAKHLTSNKLKVMVSIS